MLIAPINSVESLKPAPDGGFLQCILLNFSNLSFEKIENTLGFTTDYSVKNGAKEIYQALQDNIVTDNIKTKTVEWYKHLLNNPEDSKKFLINNTLF